MIDVLVARRIELEILGCHLGNLSLNMLREVIGDTDLRGWREQGSDDESNYQDYVTSLFRRTTDQFDWGAVAEQVVAATQLPEVSTPEMPPVESPKEEFTGDPYSLEFAGMCLLLDKLQLRKSEEYGTSWREDGDIGVYANIARKFHRLRRVVMKAIRGFNFDEVLMPKGDESYTEAIADEAVYCILNMIKRKHDNPKEHRAWLKHYKLEEPLEEPDE